MPGTTARGHEPPFQSIKPGLLKTSTENPGHELHGLLAIARQEEAGRLRLVDGDAVGQDFRHQKPLAQAESILPLAEQLIAPGR